MIFKKNEFLNSFKNIRSIPKELEELLKNKDYLNYLTKEILPPINVIKEQNDKLDNKSICSALSRIEIDKNLYNDILNNRKNHNIFLDKGKLEEEDLKDSIWFVIDESNEMIGPYSFIQMEELFKLNKINEKTLIKKKLDEKFYKLEILIKIYLKKVINKILKEKNLHLKKMIFKGTLTIRPSDKNSTGNNNNNYEFYKKETQVRYKTFANMEKNLKAKQELRHKTCPFEKTELNDIDEIADEFANYQIEDN